jgi:hypothetical protein
MQEIANGDRVIAPSGIISANGANLELSGEGSGNVTVASGKSFTVPGVINADGGIQRSSSGDMNIGTTSNTDTINIGRVGQKLDVLGNLEVSGTETVVGTTTFQANVTFQEDVIFGTAADDRMTFVGYIGTVGTPNIPLSPDADHDIFVVASANEVAGKTLDVAAGAGGADAGSNAGVGGAASFAGGAGGAGGITNPGGVGGAVTVSGGAGGVTGGGLDGAGGALSLLGGSRGGGAVADGAVNLGTSQTAQINIGASAIPLVVVGNATVQGNTALGNTGGDTVDFGGGGAVTATGNPTWNFGTGQVDFGGNVDANAGLDVTGALTVGGIAITQSGDALLLGGTGTTDAPAAVSLTTTERDALTPVGGMFVWNETTSNFQWYDGSSWESVPTAASAGGWTDAGGTVRLTTASDDVAIGVASMSGTEKLRVVGSGLFQVADDDALAFLVEQGTDDYFLVDTSNGSEAISLGNASTNPTLSQLGTGQVAFAGNVNAAAGLDVTTAALTAAAALTVSGGAFTFTGAAINLDPTGTYDLAMDAGQVVTVHVSDNLASAFLVQEGANNYIDIDTLTGVEVITLGNGTTNPDLTQLGTGQVAFAGNVNAAAGLDVTTAALTAAAALTVSGGAFTFTGAAINLDPTGTFALDMDSAQTAIVTVSDNLANAFQIKEGSNSYFEVDTTNGSEEIALGNATTNPDITQVGTGQVTFPGNVDATNGLDVTTAALTAAAGLTVSGGAINLDPTGTFTLDMDGGVTAIVTVSDNLANAFQVKEGSNSYIEVDTSNGSEEIELGNATTNPLFQFLGTGTVSLEGSGQKLSFPADGYVEIDERASDPTTGSGLGALYTKDDSGTQLFFRSDDNGAIYQLTPTGDESNATYTGVAGETIAAGNLVCLDWDAGNTEARVYLCDANETDEVSNAIGIATGASTAGNAITMQLTGESIVIPNAEWDTFPATTAVGQAVYMSETAGNVTLTIPTGNLTVQQVGNVSIGGTGVAKIIINVMAQVKKAA